jgi:nucleoporin GLE1
MEIMKPTTPHPQIIYEALLSSLAKAFVVQAETEITAREASALPLARVLVQLLAELPGLGEVLFARLVQRIGFWAIPFVAPMPSTMSKEEKDKIKGIQQGDENGEARATRIGGVMVLIFCVMHTPHPKPLPEMFRLGRFWTYVARLLSSKTLCKSNIALAILRGMILSPCK